MAGEAACLVESCAPKEMMDAIVRMESSPALREDCIRKGYLQVKRFSWNQMARQTTEIYEKVLSES